MKATMKGAVLFLALSAIPFAVSAQDWGDHGRDRGQQQQQQPANGNNGGQQQRDGRGNRDNNGRGWANRDNNNGNNNNGRGWGDRGNWQRNGNGYAQRPQMPPPPQANNYYGRGGYGGYDRGRDYRYAPPPRAYYPNRGRGYYSVGYGYRPEPVWTVGNVYYGDDYAPTYSVDDYGDYGLYAPPRGYGWRRDDFGHFILVAITTGIIADLLFGH
ncbi:MAG: RcnB family protein [Proteobacteria bacterium]|nr:RcnB family protein [Pseudomonadota bacterium]